MPCRRWPFILLALAVAAVILTFPRVSHAQGCTALSAVVGKITADNALVEMRVLEDKKLTFAARAYNADEDDEIPWETAYLVIRKDGWALLMVGFEDHVCGAQKLNPDQTRMFLKAIDGLSI